MAKIESELRKRILEMSTVPKGVHFTVTDTEELFKILDEVAKDFPFNVYFDSNIGGENYYSFCKPGGNEITDITEITREVAEWLERWFFGIKKKTGLYLINPGDSKTGDSHE